MLNFWERQNAFKVLYARCVGPVCGRYGVTRMELDILLFLANNPRYDTAADIVNIRYLSKSQVSTSVRLLEQRGCLCREYTGGNRKTAHLKLCPAAEEIVRAGREAQERFFKIMLAGFSEEETAVMQQYNDRIRKNIDTFLKEDPQC